MSSRVKTDKVSKTFAHFGAFCEAYALYPQTSAELYFSYVYLRNHKRWKHIKLLDMDFEADGISGYVIEGVDPFISEIESQYVVVCTPQALITTNILHRIFEQLEPLRVTAAEVRYEQLSQKVSRKMLAAEPSPLKKKNSRVASNLKTEARAPLRRSARRVEAIVKKTIENRTSRVNSAASLGWSFSMAIVYEESSMSFYRIHSNMFRSRTLMQLSRLLEEPVDLEASLKMQSRGESDGEDINGEEIDAEEVNTATTKNTSKKRPAPDMKDNKGKHNASFKKHKKQNKPVLSKKKSKKMKLANKKMKKRQKMKQLVVARGGR